jgi:hypothetical protein
MINGFTLHDTTTAPAPPSPSMPSIPNRCPPIIRFRTLDNVLATPRIGYVTEELYRTSIAMPQRASPRG